MGLGTLARALVIAFTLVTVLVSHAAFAAANAPTTAPSASAGDLQAHGSDDRLWLARVEAQAGRTPTELTNVYVREKSDATWRRLEPLGLRVMGLANRGSQLVLLLPGGDWRLTTEAGYASGGPLPDAAKLLTLGSDGTTLWAVGLSRAESAASTTQSTTAPSAVAAGSNAPSSGPTAPVMRTSPASRPGPTSAPSGAPKLVLYRLAAKDWEKLGGLPEEIPPSESVSLSVGVVGGMPLVAEKRDDRTIRIWRRTATPGDWEMLRNVNSTDDIVDYKLLGGTGPMLWYRGVSGPGHLWIAPTSPGAGDAIDRVLGAPAGAPHAVTVANGAVRELWIADGKIVEQRLDTKTGLPDGPPTPAILPAVSLQGAVVRVLEVTLAIALVLALLSSMRRRGELSEGELDPSRFKLAPFPLRLTAGLIDAIPLFASLVIVRLRSPAAAAQPTVNDWIIVATGVGTYLLLTTVVELAAGRSIGKLLTGLRIVGLDGRPADMSARLLRNLFRVIDLLIGGMPLALILFSPLRQRAGDLGAGTVVIQGQVKESEGGEATDANDGAKPRRPRRGDADSE